MSTNIKTLSKSPNRHMADLAFSSHDVLKSRCCGVAGVWKSVLHNLLTCESKSGGTNFDNSGGGPQFEITSKSGTMHNHTQDFQ